MQAAGPLGPLARGAAAVAIPEDVVKINDVEVDVSAPDPVQEAGHVGVPQNHAATVAAVRRYREMAWPTRRATSMSR